MIYMYVFMPLCLYIVLVEHFGSKPVGFLQWNLKTSTWNFN